MLLHCSHHAVDAAVRDSRVDPTNTGKIRRRWENDLVRRFRRVRAMIREALVKLDVLGFREKTIERVVFSTLFARAYAPTSRLRDAAPAPKAFAFETSANKVNAFMEWLYEQERAEILEVSQGTPQSTAAASAWQNVYVDSAYQSGLRSAQKALKFEPSSIAGAINQPIHADRVGIIYTRAYRDLEGITDAMDQSISRVLANGMAQGKGVLEITADLEKAVDSIGILRARTLARTEVIATHAEASLNLYEEAGVYDVEADVEFATAQDDAVCPQCQELSGERYSVEDARGVIPVHPNCRCAWLPVIT